MLPVGGRAAAWLDTFVRESRPLFDHLPHETALFLSGYGTRLTPAYLGNWIKKLLRRCGIDKPGSCHLFRHTCATDMHRGGADIRYVQELLGHARPETTQIYTHVNIEALREIHTRCHPHGKLPLEEKYHPPENTSSPFSQNPLMPQPMTAVAEQNIKKATAASNRCTFPIAPDTKASSPQDDLPPEEDGGTTAPQAPNTPPQNGPSTASIQTPTVEKPSKINDFSGRVACYGYRYYDPVTGRWPSRDPIRERGGANLYAFVGNRSIGSIDRLGQNMWQGWIDGLWLDWFLQPMPTSKPQSPIGKLVLSDGQGNKSKLEKFIDRRGKCDGVCDDSYSIMFKGMATGGMETVKSLAKALWPGNWKQMYDGFEVISTLLATPGQEGDALRLAAPDLAKLLLDGDTLTDKEWCELYFKTLGEAGGATVASAGIAKSIEGLAALKKGNIGGLTDDLGDIERASPEMPEISLGKGSRIKSNLTDGTLTIDDYTRGDLPPNAGAGTDLINAAIKQAQERGTVERVIGEMADSNLKAIEAGRKSPFQNSLESLGYTVEIIYNGNQIWILGTKK